MSDFIGQLDTARIEQAIADAENRTSGELRVVVHRKRVDDPVAAARAEFAELEMHRTRERNGVLIFIAPASRAFAIYGDEGIHARCGQDFWDGVAAAMTGHFREGRFTDGLVEAIGRAGELLAKHFPRRNDDRNELPNTIVDRGV